MLANQKPLYMCVCVCFQTRGLLYLITHSSAWSEYLEDPRPDAAHSDWAHAWQSAPLLIPPPMTLWLSHRIYTYLKNDPESYINTDFRPWTEDFHPC